MDTFEILPPSSTCRGGTKPLPHLSPLDGPTVQYCTVLSSVSLTPGSQASHRGLFVSIESTLDHRLRSKNGREYRIFSSVTMRLDSFCYRLPNAQVANPPGQHYPPSQQMHPVSRLRSALRVHHDSPTSSRIPVHVQLYNTVSRRNSDSKSNGRRRRRRHRAIDIAVMAFEGCTGTSTG